MSHGRYGVDTSGNQALSFCCFCSILSVLLPLHDQCYSTFDHCIWIITREEKEREGMNTL